MAHKKAGGSSRNGRDSKGKRLGIKAFGGEGQDREEVIASQCDLESVTRFAMIPSRN